MPYKDKSKDREWHRDYMRKQRHGVTRTQAVTPVVTPFKSYFRPVPKPT